jgi:hypothetical protein
MPLAAATLLRLLLFLRLLYFCFEIIIELWKLSRIGEINLTEEKEHRELSALHYNQPAGHLLAP